MKRCVAGVHEPLAQLGIMMPAMSPLMTEGTVTRWRKKEGDAFFPGDVLLQIESDIAMIDVQAENAGIITKILVSAAPLILHCLVRYRLTLRRANQIPDGTTNVPVEQVIALVERNPQEPARLQAQTRIQIPSRPAARRPDSPVQYDQPRSPRSSSPRPSPFRYETHLTNKPSLMPASSAGAVRGMVTNHARTLSLPSVPPLAGAGSRNIPRSTSTVRRRDTLPTTTDDQHTVSAFLCSYFGVVTNETESIAGRSVHPKDNRV